MSEQKLLICIPTYNEKDNILSLISEIFIFQNNCHILVIDDNSPDGTARLIENCPEYKKTVFLLKRVEKKGLGRAYLAGFRWAIKNDYHIVFQCDADFSHDPKYIPNFMKAFANGSELVIGSRNIPEGGVENWSYFRRLLSLFGSFYGRVILGVKIRDLTGGFNAYKISALKSLGLDSIKSNGYVFQIELKYRSSLQKLKIVEIPIIFKDRVMGESKMNLKIVLEAFWHVIYLKFSHRNRKYKRPLENKQ